MTPFRLRCRRLRRAVAVFVLGVFAISCLEPILEPILEARAAAPVGALAVGALDATVDVIVNLMVGAAAAVVATPTADGIDVAVGNDMRSDSRAPDHVPARDVHPCPCTHAVLASATALVVPMTLAAPATEPRGGSDRLPPSFTPELRLRPPVTRAA